MLYSARNSQRSPVPRRSRGARLAAPCTAASLVAAALATTGAVAATLDTGNPDLSIRFDNTVKYSLVSRTEDQVKNVLRRSAATDDASLNFDTGIVSNRFDLLSEMDVVWKNNWGFRVSGAAWYDFEYDQSDHPGLNHELTVQGFPTDTWGALSVPPGEFTDATRDLHKKDAELLDAFIFGSVALGDIDASFRLGRHTLYWGQSLLVGGAVHGIAGSMAAIDLAKGFAVPGSEAKELFLPTNKFSMSLQLTQNLALNGYYSFEFEEYRLPALGSYLSVGELFTDDAEFVTLSPGVPALGWERVGLTKVPDQDPGRGEYGLSGQYYFSDSGVEVGVYYLNYYDKLTQGVTGAIDLGKFANALSDQDGNELQGAAQTLLALWNGGGITPGPNLPDEFFDGANPAQGVGDFNWIYKEDVTLYGISVALEAAGISWGLELVRREDAPIYFNPDAYLRRFNTIPPELADVVEGFLGATEFDFDAAGPNNFPGTVGDTWHFIVNGLGFLSPTPFWDGGTYAFEFTASMLDSISANADIIDPAIEEDEITTQIGVVFAPIWYQVRPSVDVKLPMTVSYGLSGDQAPIAVGGNEGLGNGNVGIGIEYQQVWAVDLKYNFYFGSHDNGLLGVIKDRDNVSLSIKRTF
jgi:hypothetical protein